MPLAWLWGTGHATKITSSCSGPARSAHFDSSSAVMLHHAGQSINVTWKNCKLLLLQTLFWAFSQSRNVEKSACVRPSARLTHGKRTQQAFRFLFVLLVLDDVLAGRSNNVAGRRSHDGLNWWHQSGRKPQGAKKRTHCLAETHCYANNDLKQDLHAFRTLETRL